VSIKSMCPFAKPLGPGASDLVSALSVRTHRNRRQLWAAAFESLRTKAQDRGPTETSNPELGRFHRNIVFRVIRIAPIRISLKTAHNSFVSLVQHRAQKPLR
jgi:hypothetical protein